MPPLEVADSKPPDPEKERDRNASCLCPALRSKTISTPRSLATARSICSPGTEGRCSRGHGEGHSALAEEDGPAFTVWALNLAMTLGIDGEGVS